MTNDSQGPAAAGEEMHADMGIRRLISIDERCMSLLKSTNFVVVCTLSKSGAPHGTPMWVDSDGTNLLLNTEADRVWPRNLARDPRVACIVVNNDNPYEYIQVRGTALPPDATGAREHSDELARRYLGIDEYPHADRPRTIIRIVPERVVHVHPPSGGVLEETLEDASPGG